MTDELRALVWAPPRLLVALPASVLPPASTGPRWWRNRAGSAKAYFSTQLRSRVAPTFRRQLGGEGWTRCMDSRTGSRELGARRGQGLPHKSRLGLPVPLTGIREAPHSLNLSERGRVVCAWAANSVKSILGRCSLQWEPHMCPIPGLLPKTGARHSQTGGHGGQAGGRLPRAGCGQVFPGLRAVMVWSEDRGQAGASGEQHAGQPRPRLGGSPAPHEPLTFLGNPGKRTPALGEGGRGGEEGPGSGAAQLPQGGGQQVARPGATLASLFPAFTWGGGGGGRSLG